MQDDPKIAERRHERQVKKAAETAVGLTIAERLTRRANAKTIELPMIDEDGVFSIVMRQPTRVEMEDLQRAQEELQNEKSQDAANDRLCVMIARLCIDESLDYQYWMDGNYDMVDLIDLVNTLFGSLVERVKAARSFRTD